MAGRVPALAGAGAGCRRSAARPARRAHQVGAGQEHFSQADDVRVPQLHVVHYLPLHILVDVLRGGGACRGCRGLDARSSAQYLAATGRAAPTSGPRSMNLSATCSPVVLSRARTTKPKAPRFRSRICGSKRSGQRRAAGLRSVWQRRRAAGLAAVQPSRALAPQPRSRAGPVSLGEGCRGGGGRQESRQSGPAPTDLRVAGVPLQQAIVRACSRGGLHGRRGPGSRERGRCSLERRAGALGACPRVCGLWGD